MVVPGAHWEQEVQPGAEELTWAADQGPHGARCYPGLRGAEAQVRELSDSPHSPPPQPGGRPHPHTRRVRAPSTVNTCTLNPGLLRLSQEGAGEEQGGK